MLHNSLTVDTILALSNLKALADNTLNVTRKMISVSDRVENTVVTGESAGNKAFIFQSHFATHIEESLPSQSPGRRVNPLTNDNILNWSKLNAFADDKTKLAKMMISVFSRVENIVGKGENAGY